MRNNSVDELAKLVRAAANEDPNATIRKPSNSKRILDPTVTFMNAIRYFMTVGCFFFVGFYFWLLTTGTETNEARETKSTIIQTITEHYEERDEGER